MSLAEDAIKVVPDYVSKGSGGLTYASDQITYPADLPSVPDDAYNASKTAVWFSRANGLFGNEGLVFSVYGNFRQFEQKIEGDPDSVTKPVMANVYFDLERVLDEMSSKSELSVSFKALEKPYLPSPEDPRIRFVCEGHYDPLGSGDIRFRAILEVDQNANINVLELTKTDGEGNLSDNSPNGFSVGFDYSDV